jgi:hypothetical protein
MMRAWVSAFLLVGPVFSGCAGETPEARSAEAAPPAATEPLPETDSAPSSAPAADTAAASSEPEPLGPGEGQKAPPDKNAVETRTSEVIAQIVRDNRKPFRDCYEKGTKELPDLQGTLTLHFVLDPEGKVKKAELNQERSTIKAPQVVDCAISVLKGLKFPASSRGMESVINYPFDFKR